MRKDNLVWLKQFDIYDFVTPRKKNDPWYGTTGIIVRKERNLPRRAFIVEFGYVLMTYYPSELKHCVA